MEYQYIDKLHVKNKNGEYVVDGRLYEPDTNHEQFAEVWKKFNSGFELYDGVHPEDAVDDILFNLPEVMKKILTVLRKEV